MLGWTQEKIADKVGLRQNRISQIINNFSVKEIDNAFKNGKSVGEVTEKVGLAGRSSVNKVLKKFDVEEIQQAFEEGKTVEEIAEYQNLDISTTWPIETTLGGGSENGGRTRLSLLPRGLEVWGLEWRKPIRLELKGLRREHGMRLNKIPSVGWDGIRIGMTKAH